MTMYHVTVLSNFSRAFDKYGRRYRKSGIPESTYPDEFYVLPGDGLPVGAAKAARLRDRLAIPGDGLIALAASLDPADVAPNRRNGLGFVWPSPDLPLHGVHLVSDDGALGEGIGFENAMARSLALNAAAFKSYAELTPRSVSFLPIAKGCQAACPFCFSEASVSAEQKPARPDWTVIEHWLDAARRRGAERAVITGGGEPTLLRWPDLLRLVHACRGQFDTVVLITNGLRLAALGKGEIVAHLAALRDAGLSVLAVSRHHQDEERNAALMNVATRTNELLSARSLGAADLSGLRIRTVCVLQRGGVEDLSGIDDYVDWAEASGVDEVCFKELYISTSHESVYHSYAANRWSSDHQVPLSLVHDWAEARGFAAVSRLPWGAPIYAAKAGQRSVRVAAYTEPSLYWERSSGIARSWNIMADGACFASLEDRRSVVELASAARCPAETLG